MRWTTQKPDPDGEKLVIAANWTGIEWKYTLYEYARMDNDQGGFDILIFKDDMEIWFELITADKYLEVTTL